MGGPNRKPKYAMVETRASDIPGGKFLDLPAMENDNGITEDVPAPTSKNPIVAKMTEGNTTARTSPEK